MIIDLHCDTIQKAKDQNLKLDDKNLEFNTEEVKKQYIQCLAAFVHPKYNKEDMGFKRANEIIENFYKIYDSNKLYIIKNKFDLENVELKNKIGAILTIENGTAISGNINNIEKLYEKGIRMMGVVWNQDNDLACGALTKEDLGLTNLGKEYVKQLEKRNIIIDVSHMSKKSFYDTAKNTNVPIIASHSCVEKLCKHPRNLEDEQIKIIAKRQGVIGICFCKKFLTDKEEANVRDIVKHIDYIANLVGIDYISFGSDFDGVGEENKLKDIKKAKDINKIIGELKIRGYKNEDIEKICYKNFLRVAKNIWR